MMLMVQLLFLGNIIPIINITTHDMTPAKISNSIGGISRRSWVNYKNKLRAAHGALLVWERDK